MDEIGICATSGSFAWIEAPRETSDEVFQSLAALVEAAYGVWGEDYWIVRQAFCSKFPRKVYLEKLGVPYAVTKFEHSVLRVIPQKRRVLSLVFDSAEACLESIESDYADERYLFLQAFPRGSYPNAQDVLSVELDDVELFELKAVAEGRCSATLVYDPSEGTGRVFSKDDSALRIQDAVASRNAG